MTKYIVRGEMTVSCWTEVEADSAEEAIRIAEERDAAGMSHNALYPDAHEAFHFENDGTPTDLRVEED